MRARFLLLLGLVTVSPSLAFAQMKLPSKTVPGAIETRYFTAIDGLMDGNADVILKETRQGKTVTAATLDVCYPAAKGSDRKDRFVANLAVNGQSLTGTTQSLGDKLPVTVKLARKPTGDTFEFRGQITIGQAVTEVTSTDNSDLSEKEFLDNQTSDDGITPAPKDFTEVSPEAFGVRVKLDAALDFLKSLKGELSGVLAKTLAAKAADTEWNANTGKLTLTFKRPSPIYPPLALTENIEVTALVSPDKPGASDRLMLWISSPVITTSDEGTGPKLNLSEESTGDEEGGEPKDDNGSVEALAKEFKGQRWDADKSVWK